MRIVLIAIAFIIVYNGNCQTKHAQKNINLYDSAAVAFFISTSSLCDRLHYVQQNAAAFLSEKSYAIHVLKSITEESGMRLFLTVASGGIILTKESKIEELKDQIIEIAKALKCNE